MRAGQCLDINYVNFHSTVSTYYVAPAIGSSKPQASGGSYRVLHRRGNRSARRSSGTYRRRDASSDRLRCRYLRADIPAAAATRGRPARRVVLSEVFVVGGNPVVGQDQLSLLVTIRRAGIADENLRPVGCIQFDVFEFDSQRLALFDAGGQQKIDQRIGTRIRFASAAMTVCREQDRIIFFGGQHQWEGD